MSKSSDIKNNRLLLGLIHYLGGKSSNVVVNSNGVQLNNGVSIRIAKDKSGKLLSLVIEKAGNDNKSYLALDFVGQVIHYATREFEFIYKIPREACYNLDMLESTADVDRRMLAYMNSGNACKLNERAQIYKYVNKGSSDVDTYSRKEATRLIIDHLTSSYSIKHLHNTLVDLGVKNTEMDLFIKMLFEESSGKTSILERSTIEYIAQSIHMMSAYTETQEMDSNRETMAKLDTYISFFETDGEETEWEKNYSRRNHYYEWQKRIGLLQFRFILDSNGKIFDISISKIEELSSNSKCSISLAYNLNNNSDEFAGIESIEFDMLTQENDCTQHYLYGMAPKCPMFPEITMVNNDGVRTIEIHRYRRHSRCGCLMEADYDNPNSHYYIKRTNNTTHDYNYMKVNSKWARDVFSGFIARPNIAEKLYSVLRELGIPNERILDFATAIYQDLSSPSLVDDLFGYNGKQIFCNRLNAMVKESQPSKMENHHFLTPLQPK